MRKIVNLQIRNAILQRIAINQQYNTRNAINAINAFSIQFNVPKQVISGNISYIVRSGAADIFRNRPYSYLY